MPKNTIMTDRTTVTMAASQEVTMMLMIRIIRKKTKPTVTLLDLTTLAIATIRLDISRTTPDPGIRILGNRSSTRTRAPSTVEMMASMRKQHPCKTIITARRTNNSMMSSSKITMNHIARGVVAFILNTKMNMKTLTTTNIIRILSTPGILSTLGIPSTQPHL